MFFLRQLLIFVLMLAMMPGVPELMESIEHLAHDGHLPHSPLHENEDPELHAALQTEHGCTPMSHSCGCHVSIPIILSDGYEAAYRHAAQLVVVHPPDLPWSLVSRANAPPIPPPIA